MRTSFDENNHSAAKKIIPAAAMLALSAVMLSTSTYAWFTMSKEVEMTGLSMSATVGEGMEISLAAVADDNTITLKGDNASTFDGEHPKDTDPKGWTSSVVVGNYYSDIGKLKPASSVDGAKLFDATDAGNGGKTASNFKELTPLADNMAAVTKLATRSDATTVTATGNDGYYVDIPVHLRTSKTKSQSVTEGDIYCKMIIKNAPADGGNSDPNDILYKAVRVAFIPIDSNGSEGSAEKIFTVDELNAYYETGSSNGKAVNSTNSKAEVSILSKDSVGSGDAFETGDGAVSGLKIPYAANAGEYGHLDFKVRVWLEGESTSCYNQTAGQSWNIDFAFSLGKFEGNSSSGG